MKKLFLASVFALASTGAFAAPDNAQVQELALSYQNADVSLVDDLALTAGFDTRADLSGLMAQDSLGLSMDAADISADTVVNRVTSAGALILNDNGSEDVPVLFGGDQEHCQCIGIGIIPVFPEDLEIDPNGGGPGGPVGDGGLIEIGEGMGGDGPLVVEQLGLVE
jgi:hypothetical protein